MKKHLSPTVIALLLLWTSSALWAEGPRYVARGDGTVKDTKTGLIWLQNADCLGGRKTYAEAVAAVAGLKSSECGLSDGSEAGDWRLPGRQEWYKTIKPACSPYIISDDEGNDCYMKTEELKEFYMYAEPNPERTSFRGVDRKYWSSSEGEPGETWIVILDRVGCTDNCGGSSTRDNLCGVWPVRDERP